MERKGINILSYKKEIENKFVFFPKSTKFVRSDSNVVVFHYDYPSLFFKRLDLLEAEISKRIEKGWKILISTIHKEKVNKKFSKYITDRKFHSGFENSKLKIAVYTDREIFGTIFIANEKNKAGKETNRYLAQLEGEIEVNDFIVHEDHGIGVYRGIEQKVILNKKRDYLIIEYAKKDRLSVPISQVTKLTKYIGPDETPPKITRLGKTHWFKIKERVKKKVEIVAAELVKHYAKAEVAKAYSYSTHEWEDLFASKFEFNETEDQKKAIDEVLNDMEKSKAMNRLLVGDVGFGKTEVALRAAFKAMVNGKQVAVLCPTTVLVSQHHSVFKHRIEDFPLEVESLSRFNSKSENEKIVERLKQNKVDLVVGTHRLLSDDIKFKDLGLLIIDEEQKFGVMQKEKIRKLAYEIDVLSMSATPIPRTLSMALSNLRDISLITTPPPGRKAVKTFLGEINWKQITDAIKKEVKGEGQIYFVHNEVRTIETVVHKLRDLMPNVNFVTAHGQMNPDKLSKIMHNFYEKKYDCLVCTTIIENGIDIPNVNTIIINKAERFGLGQLYQLRGRVGRSNKQAFCYLFYSPKGIFVKNNKNLKGNKKKQTYSKAKQRLEAIFKAQDLGSGFKIASRDLEIRGAGNLLGKQQHGYISAVGLGLYTQLLGEEIEKLKNKNNNIQD